MGSIGDRSSNMVPPPTTKREENRSVISAAASFVSRVQTVDALNPRTRPYYHRRCKRGNPANIDSLSDDLWFEILVRLPAEDIHENARIVCRRWNRIIRGDAFVVAHFNRSCSGLLTFTTRGHSPTFVAATQGGGVETSKLSCKLRGLIVGGCNGLLLGLDYSFIKKKKSPYIVNPVTNRRFNIPPCFDIGEAGHYGIAYAAASTKYKVVATYDPKGSGLMQCRIMTVGVDSAWRRVPIEHLSPQAIDLLGFRNALITEGFMHWSLGGNAVVSLNVETEVIAETPLPHLPRDYYQGEGCLKEYLSTGRHLSVLIEREELLWEVWEMKPGTGEWEKSANKIDLRGHECEIRKLTRQFIKPVGWVSYPHVLAFSNSNWCKSSRGIIYNLDTDEIDSFDFDFTNICVVHRNSLVYMV